MKLKDTCGYTKIGGGWGKKQVEEFKDRRKNGMQIRL